MFSALLSALFSWLFILPAVFLAGSSFQSMVKNKSSLIKGVIFCACGMFVLFLAVLLLHFIGQIHSAGIWLVLILMITIRIKFIKNFIEWIKEVGAESFVLTGSLTSKFLNLIFIISFLALLAGTLSPEIGGDALCYHLNLPKVFLQKGSLTPDYFDLNSYLSVLMSYFYLVGLATGGVFSAKLFHLFCGFLLYLSVKYVIKRETTSNVLSTFGALVVWLTPTVYNMLSTTYVDIGLTFFTFLSLILLVEGLQERNAPSIFLSGLCLGCAIGVKYLAFISMVAMFVVWIYFMAADKIFMRAIPKLFIWIGGVFIASGYWAIRNWILTGNPVFPYFSLIFGTEPLSGTAQHLFGTGTTYHLFGLGKGIFDFISVFFTMFYYPSAFGAFASRPGIFYFLFLPFSFITFVAMRRLRPYFIFFAFFMVGWFLICQHHRYVVPALPVVAVLGSCGFSWFYQFASHQLRSILRIGATLFGLSTLCVYLLGGLYHYRYEFLLHAGCWTLEEYMNHMEKTAPIAKWINDQLPKDAKILIEAEPSQYYIERSLVRDIFLKYRTHYDQKGWSTNEIKDHLKSIGITHLLLSEPIIKNWLPKQNTAIRNLAHSPYVTELKVLRSENIRDAQHQYYVYQLN